MRILLPGILFVYFFAYSFLCAEQRYFNDFQLRSNFQRGLEKLLDGNQSVSLVELKKQLTQKHARVELGDNPVSTVSPNKLYDQISKSVLVIGRLYNCGKCSKWHTSMASAFAIGQDGIIVTNHHVLEKDEGEILGAMDAEGTVYDSYGIQGLKLRSGPLIFIPPSTTVHRYLVIKNILQLYSDQMAP